MNQITDILILFVLNLSIFKFIYLYFLRFLCKISKYL